MRHLEPIDLGVDEKGRHREWIFSFNHASMRELELLTGKSAWSILIEETESHTRLVNLAWCASVTFRTDTRQMETRFEDFLGMLPDYLSDDWFRFQDRINALVTRTFPRAVESRVKLQTLRAAMIMSSLANVSDLLTGTTESGPPSNSSECPPENSGTTGTG